MKTTKQQQRQTAIRAARSQARQMGIDPTTVTGRAALDILDDIAQIEPALVASIWYQNATENQARLFCREWEETAVNTCPNCGGVIDQKPTGRPAKFCKQHCRVQYWRKRQKAANGRLTKEGRGQS